MNVLIFFSGLVAGIVLTLILIRIRKRSAREIAEELVRQAGAKADEDAEQQFASTIEQLKSTFKGLAADALTRNNAAFLNLAEDKLGAKVSEGEKNLDNKRKLIDLKVDAMTSRLGELASILQNYRDERSRVFGQLKQQLSTNSQVTSELQQTTFDLREALASTKKRGEWGERMADDVLALAGLKEGINYRKRQRTEAGDVPDYTFLLPKDFKVNMDVKFPFDNYRRFVEATDDPTRKETRKQFLRDVRTRVKEVSTRKYIDPAHGTVECVILFIPNEQVYGFVHENDPSCMDDALKQKVVMCSPLTLYAVLTVIRQAVDNFRIEQASDQILSLLVQFKGQWDTYKQELSKLSKQMNTVVNTFATLETTRTNQLERPLNKIEDLRQQNLLDGISKQPTPQLNVESKVEVIRSEAEPQTTLPDDIPF